MLSSQNIEIDHKNHITPSPENITSKYKLTPCDPWRLHVGFHWSVRISFHLYLHSPITKHTLVITVNLVIRSPTRTQQCSEELRSAAGEFSIWLSRTKEYNAQLITADKVRFAAITDNSLPQQWILYKLQITTHDNAPTWSEWQLNFVFQAVSKPWNSCFGVLDFDRGMIRARPLYTHLSFCQRFQF